MKPFWVYIVRCADGSYYTGHTDNLDARISQHMAGDIPDCYTYKRPGDTVLIIEVLQRIGLLRFCVLSNWAPACAGVTHIEVGTVIPAQAGIQFKITQNRVRVLRHITLNCISRAFKTVVPEYLSGVLSLWYFASHA